MNAAAVLNHLWQTSAFVAIAAVVAWGLRSNSARVRFGVWLAASVKFLVPFSVLAAMGGAMLPWPHSGAVLPVASVAVAARFEPAVLPISASAVLPAGGVPWVSILAAIWIAGSLALAIRWFVQWRRTARLVRGAVPRAADGLRMRETGAAVEPGVFGLFRPVLLVPAGLQERLTPAQREAVVAHERCHIARRDNLWAALHRVVETVFWFHPFVWWLGARLVAERERACDEEVLRAGGDARAYASGLLGVCRHYMDAPLACASGVAGGPLQRRVVSILEGGCGRRLSWAGKLLLGVLGAVVVLTPVTAGIVYGQGAAASSFGAVSIRAAATPAAGKRRRNLQIDPRRLRAENLSLEELIRLAWGLQAYQVQGPKWMDNDIFTVDAETRTPVAESEMPALLRPFLIRQFALKTHHMTTVRPVYELEIAGGGAKVKAAKGSAGPNNDGRFPTYFDGKELTVKGTGTIGELIEYLNRNFDRPVVDRTGLKGNYVIEFSFDPKAGAPGAPKGGTSVFDALQQQLGLRMVSAKAPVDVLVVDSASRTPAGN